MVNIPKGDARPDAPAAPGQLVALSLALCAGRRSGGPYSGGNCLGALCPSGVRLRRGPGDPVRRDAGGTVRPENGSGNGGRVQVSVNDIQIDYTATDLDDASIRQMTTNVDKLHADFYTGQSGVFILDDPENFQRNHAALRYLDGSEPTEDAVDWENMVRHWNDSPVLNGLTFRNLDTASLYLGRRIGEVSGDDLWNGLFPDG